MTKTELLNLIENIPDEEFGVVVWTGYGYAKAESLTVQSRGDLTVLFDFSLEEDGEGEE